MLILRGNSTINAMGSKITVVGIMSGSSLDGVDIAVCAFEEGADQWKYDLLYSHTFEYSPTWTAKLTNAHSLSGKSLALLDNEYGSLLAGYVIKVLEQQKLSVDLISSHGHTVFHDPAKKFTLQIGSGTVIRALTGIPVVYDFRSLDIALGGEGAPLVPAGDLYLFNQYEACLNLGGFSNISFNDQGSRIAYDICPVNIALNYLAKNFNLAYDLNGNMGRKGLSLIHI